MEVSAVKQQIKENDLDSLYLFAGEEHKVLNIYIDKIAEVSGANKIYVDDLASVFSKSRQASLIKSKSVYVVMDDKEVLTNEATWKIFSEKTPFKDDIIILYFTSIDKRLKFWKQFYSRAVIFEKMEKHILRKHIQKKLPLSDENADRLMDICECDYGRCLLELDKIERYAGGKLLFDDSFAHLVKDGTIYIPPKDAIFDFVNAVLDRDINLSLDLLEQSYEVGEANMVLISVLYNSFRNLFLVQNRKGKESIGLNGWQIKNVISYVDNYSNGEIIRALKILRKIEVGIKRGEIPDDISTNYFLVEVI